MTEDEVREVLEHKERRDRFAMAALPEIMRDADPRLSWLEIAERAYLGADAMIKARDA